MTTLLGLVLGNIAVAAVLAAIAWASGRWLHRPALTHGLWLLVFLKLLTPPLLSVPVIRTPAPAAPAVVAAVAPMQPATAPARPAEAPQPARAIEVPNVVGDDAGQAVLPQPEPNHESAPRVALPEAMIPAPRVVEQPPAPPQPQANNPIQLWDWSWLPAALGWVWLAGALSWFSLAAVRLVRFHRLLRFAQPASAELKIVARGVAQRMQMQCPRLVLVPGAVSPMLWVFGRKPRLVVPASLVGRLTTSQWRTLLAHELAHWRRHDHLVRWLELITLGLYWWCPLVWWAKQQLQQAEEECCDAWVVSTLPDEARDYALALVETVDFLSGARAALPPAASGLGHVHLLQRRLTMILRGRTPRALTLTGLLVVVALGLSILPLAPTWAQDAPPVVNVVQKDAVQKDAVQKEDKGDEKVDPDKARKDLQRIQEEYLKLQKQIDLKRRELEEKIQKEFGEKQQELAKQLQEAMRKAGFPAAGLGGGLGGGLPGAPGALPPPLGGGGILQPGGLQPPAFGGQPLPVPGGFGAPRPDVERRLDDLERKLDKLIERLGGNKGPGANPGGRTPENPPAAPPATRRPQVESAPPTPPTKD